MPTHTKPITSSSDPENAFPWFEFTLDIPGGSVTFTKANGLSIATGKAPPQAESGLLKAHSIALSSTKPNEVHVLAVTMDGAVEFVPESEQKPIYYAHLAWYDPTTDELTVLEFTQP